MASIRNRSPWRVSVARDPALGGRFPSRTKAQAEAQLLAAIGHVGVRCKQETEGAWEVRVRRQGLPELVKSFATKGAAREWADVREGEIVKREFVDYREADRHTLADVLTHYDQKQLTALDKNHPDRSRIRNISAHRIGTIRMSLLKPADVAAFRNERLKLVKGSSVIKELELVSRVIRLAQRERNILLPLNPASSEHVSRPKLTEDDERDRRLGRLHVMPSAEEVAYGLAKVSGKQRLAAHEARVAKLAKQGATLVFAPRFRSILELPVPEEVALLRACRYPAWFRPVPSDRAALAPKSKGSGAVSAPPKARLRPGCRIWAIVSLAICTAMRRGEIAKLRWEDVKLDQGFLKLPGTITKNKRARVVPLSPRAQRILATQPRTSELVFDTTVESIEAAFEHALARIGAKDLRFHDNWHEATSRLFERTTLRPPEIGHITGHMDPRSLIRYCNIDPDEFVNLISLPARLQGSAGFEWLRQCVESGRAPSAAIPASRPAQSELGRGLGSGSWQVGLRLPLFSRQHFAVLLGTALVVTPFILAAVWSSAPALHCVRLAEEVQGTVVEKPEDALPTLVVACGLPNRQTLMLQTDGDVGHAQTPLGASVRVCFDPQRPQDAKPDFWLELC